jgi:hypothetical protein
MSAELVTFLLLQPEGNVCKFVTSDTGARMGRVIHGVLSESTNTFSSLMCKANADNACAKMETNGGLEQK